jgi:hypothetical protein
MEAFLLALDMLFIVLLLRNIGRVFKSGNQVDLGIFRFHEFTGNNDLISKKRGADIRA